MSVPPFRYKHKYTGSQRRIELRKTHEMSLSIIAGVFCLVFHNVYHFRQNRYIGSVTDHVSCIESVCLLKQTSDGS